MSHGIVPVCFSSSPLRESKEISNREKSEKRRDFIAQKTRNGAEVSLREREEEEGFLSTQADAFAGANAKERASACSVRNDGVGGGKIGVSLRMRGELRAELMAFAEREKRSLGGLIAILVEWSFERLRAAGSTTKLFGQSAKRLNKLTSDKRLKHG